MKMMNDNQDEIHEKIEMKKTLKTHLLDIWAFLYKNDADTCSIDIDLPMAVVRCDLLFAIKEVKGENQEDEAESEGKE